MWKCNKVISRCVEQPPLVIAGPLWLTCRLGRENHFLFSFSVWWFTHQWGEARICLCNQYKPKISLNLTFPLMSKCRLSAPNELKLLALASLCFWSKPEFADLSYCKFWFILQYDCTINMSTSGTSNSCLLLYLGYDLKTSYWSFSLRIHHQNFACAERSLSLSEVLEQLQRLWMAHRQFIWRQADVRNALFNGEHAKTSSTAVLKFAFIPIAKCSRVHMSHRLDPLFTTPGVSMPFQFSFVKPVKQKWL